MVVWFYLKVINQRKVTYWFFGFCQYRDLNKINIFTLASLTPGSIYLIQWIMCLLNTECPVT